jgi:hypothetical protein
MDTTAANGANEMNDKTIASVTDQELAEHAALGGQVITPRFGTTEAERAELRAAGFDLADEGESK